MPDTVHPLAGRRILVVEDEYFIAMEVKRWLVSVGAELVGPVPSVDQALDLIEAGRLDAAVLDVNLGDGGTVYPVADALADAGVPFLFATGDVTNSSAVRYRDRPKLEKPLLENQLVNAVAKLLG